MKDNVFAKNLSILSQIDPALFYALTNCKPNEKYEVFMDSDPANYNIIDKGENTTENLADNATANNETKINQNLAQNLKVFAQNPNDKNNQNLAQNLVPKIQNPQIPTPKIPTPKIPIPMYLSKPIDEIMQKNTDLVGYSYYPFLYMYGLGNGVLLKLLFNEQRQRIVVFEPELEIIFIVLNLLDFSSELQSQKLVIIHSPQANYIRIDSLFDSNKYARIFVKTYDLLLSCNYYEKYQDDILRINGYFIKAIEQAVVSVGNDAQDSLIGILHHIINLPDSLRSPNVDELYRALKSRDTAIIISTGPSLHKQLPLLKSIAPYATLLCVDASFPILHKHGIKPDIVISLERVKESARFYTDTPKEAQEGVIFCLTSIVHNDTKNAITNGIKQFSFRPFGYTSLFGFHEYGYLGIGMSAANMAYEIAMGAKFKRCVFIGQDLAFGQDGRTHSQDAIYGTKEKQYKQQGIMIQKYGGGGEVETSKVWKLFLHFFEKDIARTKEMEVINSTEGGARINGTKEIPFAKVCEMIKSNPTPKSAINLATPSQKMSEKNIILAYKKCLDIIKYGKNQKKKIEAVFLRLVKELERVENLNKKGQLDKIDFDKLGKISEQIEGVKSLFSEVKFTNYFLDAIQSYIFHQELDIAKVVATYTKDEEGLKAKQLEWLYYHKYWLFSLAGGIDCVIESVKRGLGQWQKNDLAIIQKAGVKMLDLSSD